MLITEEKGRDLSSYIGTCLKFGQFTNASDQQKGIANSAKEALLKIGRESAINKRRVMRFGIKA
jgi:hypothetical protein